MISMYFLFHSFQPTNVVLQMKGHSLEKTDSNHSIY
uniref:Uncharacterized protein n=1 Tax=Rhizophora mucronata TaxID=61149 RepID=A0A2P2QUD1_RHIMU